MPRGEMICPGCRVMLSEVKGALCLKCGKELVYEEGEYCFGCMRHPKSFVSGAALLNYNEVSAQSMVQIKYKNKREYLDFYSREMADKLGRKIAQMNGEALIPVPVHPERLRKRGFNQAQRLKNLEQAFSVREGSAFCSLKSAILVDDIYTTGSTIEACTRVLHKAGIGKIYFLAICIGGDK